MNALLGMGTYRTRHIPQAGEAAIRAGVDWIDTAPNYQHGTAENQLAPLLSAHPTLRVSTKVGYLAPPQQQDALHAGVLEQTEADQGHNLSPAYVAWQATRSKATLGRVPDITFVHNPEHGDPTPTQLAHRIQQAFHALEECCAQGLIKGYGVAAWSAFHDGSLTVEALLDMARMAGGPAHRLHAIQLPLSLVHIGPIADAMTGHGVLIDAQSAGLDVYASAPLNAGDLPTIITPAAAHELLPGATPLQIILGTVASTPGVGRVLLSASTPTHWTEAAEASRSALDSDQLRRVTRAFAA